MLRKITPHDTVTLTDEMYEIIMGGNFTLTEIKLINIYIGLVDQSDPSTRDISIKLIDVWPYLQDSEDWKSNGESVTEAVKHLSECTYLMFHRYEKKLFRTFRTYQDKQGSWILEMSAHDDIMDYVFPDALRLNKELAEEMDGATVTINGKKYVIEVV